MSPIAIHIVDYSLRNQSLKSFYPKLGRLFREKLARNLLIKLYSWKFLSSFVPECWHGNVTGKCQWWVMCSRLELVGGADDESLDKAESILRRGSANTKFIIKRLWIKAIRRHLRSSRSAKQFANFAAQIASKLVAQFAIHRCLAEQLSSVHRATVPRCICAGLELQA